MATIFQVGAAKTFFEGAYEGTITYAELAKKGDFGLGTFNRVDGEMIVVDGVFYRIDKEGKVSIAKPNDLAPYAMVSYLQKTQTIAIKNINSMEACNQFLDANLPTKDIFYMIRINCELTWIKFRSEGCQPYPYKPLADTLPKLQNIFEAKNSSGVLAVTYCPQYSEGIAITGFHYHFIDDARRLGGHAYDFVIKTGEVIINSVYNFEMALIQPKS